MTKDEIAEIAKGSTKAELAAEVARLRETLTTVGESGAYAATVESVEADGPSTRITLVVPETFGAMWTDFRAGDTVSISDNEYLAAAICAARDI